MNQAIFGITQSEVETILVKMTAFNDNFASFNTFFL